MPDFNGVGYSLVWPVLFGAWCISGYQIYYGDDVNIGVPVAMKVE